MPQHLAVRHIKTAHGEAKKWLPLASALITLLGFALTITEADETKDDVQDIKAQLAGQALDKPIILTAPTRPLYRPLLSTLAHLAGALLRVVVGTVLVGALVGGYVLADNVAQAVMLTLLLVAVVWLSSLRVAR